MSQSLDRGSAETPMSCQFSNSPTARRRAFALVAFLALIGPMVDPAIGTGADPPKVGDEGFFDALKYRHVGPVGNRVPAVVGVAGDLNTYFIGAASGGVWKSDDGGHQWRPIFDQQAVASIGALAVAPSDANVVWVGTGEAFLRSNISMGNGVYRSTDGGDTWQHVGLEDSGRISRVVVHPDNPDLAFVAALGHTYGPQGERGIFRTSDGGLTWDHVLFVDEATGASDLVMDPNNPRILFAGTWQIEMNTFGRTSGGPGSGLWTSRDGGDSWDRLQGSGLPDEPWGKVALGMSKADSKRIYALIETNSNRDFAPLEEYAGSLWRSDDGGDSWEMVNADNTLHQRPLYYSRLLPAPDDADEVHFMAVQQSLSLDGGVSIEANNSGWDHHDIWIDPLLPDRIITGHDGGVSISTNRGKSWHRPQLPIAQMYHVAVDRQIPYFLYGNRQDGDAMRGPSNTLDGGEIPIGAWRSVGGCEVGFTLPDPSDPKRVWSGCYDGILNIYDENTGLARDVSVWPEAAESWPAADLKYRFQWTFPMAISPHAMQGEAGREVVVGSHVVHRSRDLGQSWEVISPDLTTADPQLMERSGGLTLDDAGPTLGPTLFALAYSPRNPGELWAGSNDGRLHLTRDDGQTWTDLSSNLPAMPRLATVSNIEPSRHRDGVAYVALDAHQMGDFAPHLYRTSDYGATWSKIVAGLEETPLAYTHVVREDPVRPGLLYAGTGAGLFVSFDEGGSWHDFRSNLPPAPVHWLEIQDHFQDLVVATYGRGFWILDDLSMIQEMHAQATENGGATLPSSSEAYFFAPRPAYRFRQREAPQSQPADPVAGTNPTYGASFHFYLPHSVQSVVVEVVDAEDKVIRKLDSLPSEAGMHRSYWDLRREKTPAPKLRTRPEENSKVPMPEEGWRALRDGGTLALLSPPGSYTLRLRLGPPEAPEEEGKEAQASAEEGMATATEENLLVLERKLQILPDPNSGASAESLRSQFELLTSLEDMATRAARLINECEWQRRQLDDLEARLEDLEMGERPQLETRVETVRSAADALASVLAELEGRFFDLRLTGARQDTLRWKRLLWAKIGQLAWQVGQGDVAPTESQHQVHDLLLERLVAAEARFGEIVDNELARFQETARENAFPVLILEIPPDVESSQEESAEAGGEQAEPRLARAARHRGAA